MIADCFDDQRNGEVQPVLFEKGRFLTVVGEVSKHNQLAIQPCFEVDFRRAEKRGELEDRDLVNALVLEFLDDQQQILTQYPLLMTAICNFDGVDTGDRTFAAAIPFPAEFHFIRFYVKDELIKVVKKAAKPPRARWLCVPQAAALETQVIEWQIERNSDDDTLSSMLLYSNNDGAWWEPITPPSFETHNKTPVSFSRLPGGRAQLKLVITDGFITRAILSEPFDVPVKGIRVSILGPASGERFPSRLPVWFHGQVYDLEKQTVESEALTWVSSRDGQLGQGSTIAVKLSPGVHQISAACREHSANIKVHVEE